MTDTECHANDVSKGDEKRRAETKGCVAVEVKYQTLMWNMDHTQLDEACFVLHGVAFAAPSLYGAPKLLLYFKPPR